MDLRLVFLLLVSLGTFSSAHAQFGFTASMRINSAPDWNIRDLNNNSRTDLPGNNYALALDYWIPLGSTRIDFVPELNVSRYDQDVPDVGQFAASFYSLFLNTNFYFLDFKGDCNCPTFSKSGPTLQKGLFLQISPGATYLPTKITTFDQTEIKDNSIALSIGAALGFDLGLSDLITVTPIGGVRYYPEVQWKGLETALADPSIGNRQAQEKSALTQVFAGVRLGIRLNP